MLDNPPRAGVGDGQLVICGRLRRKQPYLFPSLDGILLILVSADATLDGMGELNLYQSMGLELVIFQPAYIVVGCQRSTRESAKHIQGEAGFLP